jgi:hypothetical protein
MFKPPSVNQITSAYTGRMPQLAQRVDQDKKAHGGIPQDLRQLMALNDMTQVGNNAGIQTALNQPMQPPTIAEDIKRRAQQVLQTKMTQAAMQNNQKQGNMGLPAGLPQPQFQPEEEQGIDRLPTNVGESYAHGGIISFAEGDEVPERDILRRMEAAAYDQTNPTPAPVPQSADEIIMKAMQVNEAQKRAEAEARRGAITRDTTSMDALQAELKAQRERLNGPKPGFDALMEYLSQVANAPRGISSFAAGAYGAGKQKELENARLAQQHELTKQMLEVGQKKADIGYQQKMDIYGAGESAEAAAIKDKYAAAINRSTNQFEREKLASQMEMDLKKLEADKARTAAMNKPETYEKIYAELQRLNPNASKADLLTQATIISGINRTESVDAKNSKAYIDAKEKIDARFQHLINDTPYGKGQKKLYDDAIRDLDATYKIGGGSGGIKELVPTAAPIPPGAGPSDLNAGTVYQTSKGAAKWNGKAFEPV